MLKDAVQLTGIYHSLSNHVSNAERHQENHPVSKTRYFAREMKIAPTLNSSSLVISLGVSS